MALSPDEQDPHFALAHDAWRQFYGLHIDAEAPTQPEIDARLVRYQRVHETAALRDFGAAALLLGGLGKVLADGMRVFLHAQALLEMLVFALTCGLLVVVGAHTLTRLRRALEHRALAQRIGTEAVPWSKVDALFADVRDPRIRSYIQGVRAHARPLRRAETAVLLERSRGGKPVEEAGEQAFRAEVRARSGPSRLELSTVALCLVAGLATNLPEFNPATLVPALWLLAVMCLGHLLHAGLQLVLDPWGLRGGGPRSRQLRWALAGDLVPQTAVILVAIATATGITALSR